MVLICLVDSIISDEKSAATVIGAFLNDMFFCLAVFKSFSSFLTFRSLTIICLDWFHLYTSCLDSWRFLEPWFDAFNQLNIVKTLFFQIISSPSLSLLSFWFVHFTCIRQFDIVPHDLAALFLKSIFSSCGSV